MRDGRGPCNEHGCFCQEFWKGRDTPRCEACRHHENFHKRWQGSDVTAERLGYGSCKWAKVEVDDDGEPVLNNKEEPNILRSCKCTEFGADEEEVGAGLQCVACRHHRSFHKLLLGSGTTVGIVLPAQEGNVKRRGQLPGPTPAVEIQVLARGKGVPSSVPGVLSGQCSAPGGSSQSLGQTSGNTSAVVAISDATFGDKVYFSEWSSQLPGNVAILCLVCFINTW